jgi:ATP synthase protein I
MAAMSLIGPEGRKQLQLAARFATAGLELVISIVVGYFGGRALDRWLGSEPYCGYVGLLLGIVAGFRNLFLLARRASVPSVEPADQPASSDQVDEPNKKP